MITQKVFNWRSNLVSGLLVAIPLFSSVAIIWWLLELLTSDVQELILSWFPKLKASDSGKAPLWLRINLQILIITSYVLIIYIIGLITRNVLGRQLLNSWDNFVAKIPVLRTVHSTFKQILTTLLTQEQHEMFNKVVLVEYPKKDMYVIGFLTGTASSELTDCTKHEKLKSVFIPTTPNPTSGFLLFVPEKDMQYLEMSVTEGMQLVISGGSIMPGTKTVKVADQPQDES